VISAATFLILLATISAAVTMLEATGKMAVVVDINIKEYNKSIDSSIDLEIIIVLDYFEKEFELIEENYNKFICIISQILFNSSHTKNKKLPYYHILYYPFTRFFIFNKRDKFIKIHLASCIL